MQECFAEDLLNALSARIAVLDADGFIVSVNDAWRQFARDNGGEANGYVGANYFEVCKEATHADDSGVAQALTRGFRELLSGQHDQFTTEYSCHSPSEQHWFRARVTRFSHQGATYLATVHDEITTRKLTEQSLHRTEATLRQVIEQLPIGVWLLNEQGKIIHGNPAGQRIWCGARYVGPEQFGEYKGWWMNGEPIAAEDWAAARAIRKGETSIDEEVRIECFNGTRKIILQSAIPLRDPAGGISGAVVLNQDITARKHAEDELVLAKDSIDATNRELQQVLEREQRKARTDDLTGLCNRREFFHVSAQLFAVAKRYRSPISIILFDVDHFKRVNDGFGHQVGDVVLQRIARVAREHTRKSDVLARYGGEEFILTLPETSADEALAVAENIRLAVARSHEEPQPDDAKTTISAGVAEMWQECSTLEQLIQCADAALYAAKRAGRDCSRICSDDRDG